LQEADGSQLWIEFLREDCGIDGDNIERLHMATDELIGIFVTMTTNTKRPNRYAALISAFLVMSAAIIPSIYAWLSVAVAQCVEP
jgi:hypothetical protein